MLKMLVSTFPSDVIKQGKEGSLNFASGSESIFRADSDRAIGFIVFLERLVRSARKERNLLLGVLSKKSSIIL